MARSRCATASACSPRCAWGDGEHIERVVVVGIFVANEAEMRDGLIVLPAVDGERRGVEPLVDCLWRRFAGRGLPLADVQVQADAFEELLLIRKLTQHRLEQPGRLVVRMALQRLEPPFINRDRFEVCRSPLRRRRGRRLAGERLWRSRLHV